MKLFTTDNQFIKEADVMPNNFTGIAILPNTSIIWYKNGVVHREDGPAMAMSDGTKMWFIDGKRHNLNGAAVVWADGDKEFWFNDKEATKEQHDLLIDLMKLKNLS